MFVTFAVPISVNTKSTKHCTFLEAGGGFCLFVCLLILVGFFVNRARE